MKTRTPVWAINYQNQMDDYFSEMRRNNERNLPVERVSESDLIKAEVELFDTMSKHSGQSPAECQQMLKDELGKLPKRETESEADRKFIESMDRIREANANVKKRFSWAGLFWLLAVAAVVMLLTYWAVEGF